MHVEGERREIQVERMIEMTNKMQVFRNSEFGELGVVVIDGKEMFPATDCARMLGYANPRDAIKRHTRYVVKHDLPHPQNPGKIIEINFIPEGDLFRLIVNSTLPTAEKIERWIFDEVLPAIRKYGAYTNSKPSASQAFLADPIVPSRLSKVPESDKIDWAVRHFISQCCVEHWQLRTSRADFYYYFVNWCREQNAYVPIQAAVTAAVNRLGRYKQKWGLWFGLGLREDIDTHIYELFTDYDERYEDDGADDTALF